MGFAAGHRRLVPAGLTPELHFQIAAACDNPLDSLTAVPDDLDFACRMPASIPDLGSWQRQNWRRFLSLSRRASDLQSFFERRRPPTVRTSAPHVSPSRLECASRFVGWPDTLVGWLGAEGATVVGKHPCYCIFRDSKQPSSDPHSMASLLEGADAWYASLTRAAAPAADYATQIFAQSLEEQEAGILGEW